MRRLHLASIVVLFVATSCFLRSSPRGAADELNEIAGRVDKTTYAAVYRFGLTRQSAPGVSTRLEITQQAPVTVRRIDTSTKSPEGRTITLTSWFIHEQRGDFACNEFPRVGIRCERNPIAYTEFGTVQLDVFFDTPRQKNAFASVRKAARPVRVAGQPGTCFEAVLEPPSPPPASPVPSPERFRYELCYADDGVLLSGRRTTLDDSGGTAQASSFVEVVSLSHVVEPGELKLPGPVVDAAEIPR